MYHSAPGNEQLPYYGAANFNGKPMMRGGQRFNVVGMALSLFVPWILFCFVTTVNTFTTKYNSPSVANVATFMCFGIALLFGYLAFAAARKWKQGGPSPAWYVFIFVTSMMACAIGQVSSQMNYTKNMRPYYDVISLNAYPSVDPSKYKGQQLMDMGQVTFTSGSHLELTKSIGFRNLDTYCVAPIVSANSTGETYDFWAVGLNCCSGHTPDFACGEYNNPLAHSGLRLMRDDLRSYFRLAVQQAVAAYNIKANHPIFLYWMQDPTAEVNAYQDQGYKEYIVGISLTFGAQLFLVALAALGFNKIGM